MGLVSNRLRRRRGAADGETLWVAAWRDDAPSGAFLALIGLHRKTGLVLNTFRAPLAEALPRLHGPRVGVIHDAGVFWLVARRTPHSRSPQAQIPQGGDTPTIERLDTRSQACQIWDAAASAGDLPPSVRPAAALACPGPPPAELREHLPGWFSPAADLPVAPEDVRRQPLVRLVDEAEAAVWTVAERNVLVRQPQNGGEGQRYPLPDVILPRTPPVWAVAILNDVLYASTTDGLWRRSLPDGIWTLIPLPEAAPNRHHSPNRLLPVGDNLWVGTPEALWRYEPASSGFHEIDAEPFKQGSMRLRLLDYDMGVVWLVDRMYGHHLYRVGPDEEEAQQVPPTIRSGADIDGVCGGHVWYLTRGVRERPGHTEVIGYDLNAGQWSPPLYIEGYCSQVSLRAAEGSVFVVAGMSSGVGSVSKTGGIFRYDLRDHQWENAAPPPPLEKASRPGSDTPLRLVSVELEAFWLVNPRATALLRWDRERRVWREYSTGTTTPSSYPEQDGSVVRRGNYFFIASAHGLWQFDSLSETWTLLSFPTPASRRLEVVPRFVDDRAVWALYYDAESRQTFAARFDKRERTWRLWNESDGFPVGQGPTQFATDGSSAVVMTYSGGFFSLDVATDRWREGTADLSRAWAGQEGVRVYQPDLLGDPPNVWVQGWAQWDDDHKGLPPARDPLAMRWDVSGGFVRMEPPGWSPSTDANIRLLGSDLLADDEAVWVMNLQGLWRWDKANQTWHFLDLPRSFPDRFVLTIGHMECSADGAVWLVGRDTLLRWSAPERPEV